MAKCATLGGLPNLAAAFLNAGLPLVPARSQGPQMSILPTASLTNATNVWRRLAQVEHVRAALIAPSDEAPESVVERTDAVADPSVAAIGIFSDGMRPPPLSPAALIGISQRDVAALPVQEGFDKAKPAFQAQGLTVP
ncbi:MAG TPA: hypothetical protein VH519_05025 [Hyphomicrobiaceae bacterium]